MADTLHDPTHWRERAEKTRAKADGFRVSESDRQRLLKIAAEYDQIADRAEQLRPGSEL